MDQFKQQVFQDFSNLLYQTTGIYVGEQKKSLLFTKISRLLRKKQMTSIDDYWKLLNQSANTDELQEFIDIMTTNTTEFFREINHFHFLKNNAPNILQHNPRINRDKTVRVWSAACSSGQEPVTLAMVLNELWGDRFEVKILATDISSRILNQALAGFYTEEQCRGVPNYYLHKYFSRRDDGFAIKDSIKNMIKYRQFNLLQPYSFQHGFDLIFCRNVLIYFDNQEQQELAQKFYKQLVPGGLLFLGHSESLFNKEHEFKSVGHSIYLKD